MEVHDVVTVDSKDFCPPVETVYMVFPEPNWTYDNGLKLCRRFGGTMVYTNTKHKVKIAMDVLWYLKRSLMNGKMHWKRVVGCD